MEGVLLVEMSSGSLHYTKSFSDAFDARHPKTERLNLSALIFALQNFAGSSIRQRDANQPGIAEIAMLSTPQEKILLAATPSNKILVVLFTVPEFETHVAKLLVHRIAFNLENGGDQELQLMAVLNQVPRRFRHAFAQAVDETIERQLVSLSESLFLGPTPSVSGQHSVFLFLYYSKDLDESSSSDNNAKDADPGEAEEEERKPARTVNPTLSQLSRKGSQNLSFRNMMASTRAIAASNIAREEKHHTKSRKKARRKARNAVMDHAEPEGYQRVIEVSLHDRKAAVMEPHQTGAAYGTADVLLSFVELSALSLFSAVPAYLASNATQPPQLHQIVWKNIPSTASKKAARPQEAPTACNIVAWRCGRCLLFYPVPAAMPDPQRRATTRLAVTALFEQVDALLRAKSRTQA